MSLDKLIAYTDGACVGNPGLMGIGGIIYRQNKKIEMFSEPAGYGTNNEAEYLAVIRALELAIPYTPGSILVCSDSQLVVYQIIGEYGINYPHLARLNGRVMFLVSIFPGKVAFQWVPRKRNSEADALASKAAGMPQAVIDGNEIVPWRVDEGYHPTEEELSVLPSLREECSVNLNGLLQLRDNAKFKDFVKLKTGGIDNYSRASVDLLSKYVAARFGLGAVAWLEKVVGSFDTDYGKKALRWAARGLPPDMALKKVSVDMEIQANFAKSKKVAGRA